MSRVAAFAGAPPPSGGSTWVPLDLRSLLDAERFGAPVEILDALQTPEPYDAISHRIYEALLEATCECAQIAGKDGSEFANLAAVGFHEALRMACGYWFKAFELAEAERSGARLPRVPRGAVRAPYVGYDFVAGLEPGSLRLPPEIPRGQAWRRGLRSVASRLRGAGARGAPTLLAPRNGFADAMAARPELVRLTGEPWRILLSSARDECLHVPRLESQFQAVLGSLDGLFEEIPQLSGRWPAVLRLIEQRLRRVVVERPLPRLRASAVLSGSLSPLESRLLAARAKAEHLPVVSLFHGEACGVHDEPIFGYGESTFADVVIGYGEAGCRAALEGRYTSPLVGRRPRCIPSRSDMAARLHDASPIPRIDLASGPRLMYAPTLFSGHDRYGPFRDLNDVGYYTWQRGLLQELGVRFPGRVLWKPHAEDSTEIGDAPPGVSIVHGRLEQMFGLADVFLFDYVSTGFTLAAATAKPIVLFDIGLRNLTPLGADVIGERVVAVRAEARAPREAVDALVASSGRECRNGYTSAFSLGQRPRSEAVAEALCDLLG